LIANRGEPTELPPTLQWCTEAGRTRERSRQRHPEFRAECSAVNPACRRVGQKLGRCAGTIASDLSSGQHYEVYSQSLGSVVLGVTTAADGQVRDVCLLHSDLGNTPAMLDCFARGLRAVPVRVMPNQIEIPWEFIWSPDEKGARLHWRSELLP
jgi:hypothetical protein